MRCKNCGYIVWIDKNYKKKPMFCKRCGKTVK